MDPLLTPGEQEEFKLLVHLGLFGLGVTCGLYSAGACLARPARHLMVNTAAYGLLTAWEVIQIRRHWRGMCDIRRERCG